MATRKSGTFFVQTGKVVEEGPTVTKEVLPAKSPEAKQVKKEVQEIVDAKKKLQNLTAQSHIIYQTQSVFPFQLFPDKVIIELDKVTIIHRTFAWKHIFPVPLHQLNSVTVSRGFLFAALSLEISGYEKNPDDVVYLRPEEAAKAKRYILGLMFAIKQGVDVLKIPMDELKTHLEEIGQTTGEIETLPMV